MSRVKYWVIVGLVAGGIVVAEENIQIGDSDIIGPMHNMYLALNDFGAPDGPTTGTTIQGNTRNKIKKILSLDKIPIEAWALRDKMYVSVYMYVGSVVRDGLDESFDIVVNGNTNTFPTACGIGKSFGKFGWFDFAIPKEQFSHGKNSIVIGKSDNSTDNDDYIYVGINYSRKGQGSFKSSDSGKTWNRKSLARKNASEYMVRIRMDMPGCDFALNQDRSKIADYDLNPPVKKTHRRYEDLKTICNIANNMVVLENRDMKMVLEANNHLVLKSVINKVSNTDLISETKSAGQLFLLEINRKRYYAQDLTLLKVIPLKNQDGKIGGAKFILEEKQHGIKAEFSVEIIPYGEVQCKLLVVNSGAKELSVNTAFPLLSGVRWGEDIEDDYYLFPYSGSVISPLAGKYDTAYGDSAYVQLLTSYAPNDGAGVYLRCNDRSGGYKVLSLKKQAKQSFDINEVFNTPKVLSKLPGRVNRSFFLHNPLPETEGTSMSFSYLKRTLKPGSNWQLPSASIIMVAGDWHAVMDDYRKWFRSWANKRPYPSKLVGTFCGIGTWMKSCHTDDGYKAEYPDYCKNNFLEFYGWWEQEKLTPEFIDKNKKLAMEQAGKEWKPWKGRQHEGYLFGNCGDYGSRGYNERWGGLPAFKKHILATKQQGMVANLYVEGILADVTTDVGRKHGPEWGVVKKDGTYLWSYNLWNMCVDTPGWGDYLADTAKRLITETGCDGIRFDQFGHAGWVCHSTNHTHTFALPGHNAWVQAEADICRRVRIAMDSVDETSVLMTEYPGHEVMSQHLDGSRTYDSDHYEGAFPHQPVFTSLFRFYFPECKLYELLFKNYRETAIRDMFFNGLGRYDPYPKNIDKLLHENSDAFDSLDITPLIPTLARKVYVNRFSGKNKTIYNILNLSGKEIDGKIFDDMVMMGNHLVNVETGMDISTYRSEKKTTIKMQLKPEQLYCIGVFPELISFKYNNLKKLTVHLKHGITGELVVALIDGKEIFKVALSDKDNDIDISRYTIKKQPLVIKIYDMSGELLDIKSM